MKNNEEDFYICLDKKEDKFIEENQSEQYFDYHVDDIRVAKHEWLLNKYCEIIKPCDKTLFQLSDYIKNHYQIKPVENLTIQQNIQNDFIMKNSNSEMKNTPIYILAYEIVNSGLGKQLYENLLLEHEEYEMSFEARDDNYIKSDFEAMAIIVAIEFQTKYWNVFGSQTFADELVIFMGVSARDINEKNNNFLRYLLMLDKYNLLN